MENADGARAQFHLHYDVPQTKIDDYGRKSFAEQLAKLLNLPRSSRGIVAGIEGAWGAGKSTVIRYLLESLPDGDDGPIVIEFNPWMLSGVDALVEALLTEMAVGIGIRRGEKQGKERLNIAKKMLGYVSFLRYLKILSVVPRTDAKGMLIGGLGDAFSFMDSASKYVGDATDEGKKALKDIDELLERGLSLTQMKKEVTKELSSLDRGILIVVDDLDRLTPEEIRAVFQTIKALADFPRVAYLLAYDRQVVADSLGNGDSRRGADYIEKIVQVAYPISPAFPWQLQKHFSALLNETFRRINRTPKPFETDILEKAKTHACALCRHPRDVVRLMNRLTLSLSSAGEEINAADVIVAEALFQRFPEIRDSIVRRPENYTGSPFETGNDFSKVHSAWALALTASKEERKQAWEKDLPTGEGREVAALALCFLFPMLEDKKVNEDSATHRRLSDTQRLTRFFALTSVDGVQDLAEIEQMLKDPTKIVEVLSSYSESNSKKLIDRLSLHLGGIPDAPHKEIVLALIGLLARRNDMWLRSVGLPRAVADFVVKCLGKDQKSAPSILKEFVSQTPLVYGRELLFLVGLGHGEIRGLDDQEIRRTPKYIEEKSAVSDAIEIWRHRAHALFSTNEALSEPRIFSVLQGLAELGAIAKRRDACEALRTLCLKTSGGFAYFLEAVISYDESASADVRYSYVWDADELATLIEGSTRARELKDYVQILRTHEGRRQQIANTMKS